jgi:hypothetical protein
MVAAASPGGILEWVLFNNHETGTACGSVCNEKREKFLFILLAIENRTIA